MCLPESGVHLTPRKCTVERNGRTTISLPGLKMHGFMNMQMTKYEPMFNLPIPGGNNNAIKASMFKNKLISSQLNVDGLIDLHCQLEANNN